MKVAVVQLNSKSDKEFNLTQVTRLVTEAYEKYHPTLIALPEMFAWMGGNINDKKLAAENSFLPGDAILLLKNLAKKLRVVIHGGSLCEKDSDHFFNTTLVIDESGDIIASYRKINLFSFSGQKTTYDESILLSPGNEVITYQLGNITIGCAICFDLRFCDLFQQFTQKNVDIIIIPSAFTYETGSAHWEILCRARAIETQSFVLAPAQTGYYQENGEERRSFGHSMIIDPWGNILARLEEEVGFIGATLDLNFLQKVRQRLPCR